MPALGNSPLAKLVDSAVMFYLVLLLPQPKLWESPWGMPALAQGPSLCSAHSGDSSSCTSPGPACSEPASAAVVLVAATQGLVRSDGNVLGNAAPMAITPGMLLMIYPNDSRKGRDWAVPAPCIPIKYTIQVWANWEMFPFLQWLSRAKLGFG